MTKIVQNKNLIFGDGRISVQSMTDLPVTDTEATAEQIRRLVAVGCDIVRIAIPRAEHIDGFRKIRDTFPALPLVADIHFDYRLAVAAMQAGADKVRINPGNIPQKDLDSIVHCAKECNTIVRIGTNAGSLDRQVLSDCNGDKVLAMYRTLQDYIRYFEKNNFTNLVLSAKCSDVPTTVKVNRLVAQLGYPMHIGVTEAGPAEQGIVKNAIGIGSLLLDGIGDTIRVSLTADPTEEVRAAYEILRSIGKKQGVTFVSCPKCGRCSINLDKVAQEIYLYVKDKPSNVKIAVMGCEVNGPGECADADLGLAGAAGKFVFFKKGKKYMTVDAENGVQLFKKEIDLLLQD